MSNATPSDGSVLVCRCENLTWAEIEDAIETLQPTSLRQLKLVTRWGMGICQGRVCRPLMAAVPVPDREASDFRLTVRPPYKPFIMGGLEPISEED